MEHNRRENIMNRPHNIYGENLWRGPRSRADVERLTRRQGMGTMRWDPQASWIQGNNRTMHWDPNENWNADVSVADAVHRRNSNRLEQVALNANEFVSSPALAAIVASAVANQRQGGKSRKHKKSNQKHKKSNQKHKKSIRRRKH